MVHHAKVYGGRVEESRELLKRGNIVIGQRLSLDCEFFG